MPSDGRTFFVKLNLTFCVPSQEQGAQRRRLGTPRAPWKASGPTPSVGTGAEELTENPRRRRPNDFYFSR